jgi:HTH-like domain
MRRIDELHLDYPFAGSRMLQTFLVREGYDVGRLHVARLMKRMGVEAIYRRPNTSKPAPGHTISPYLLRKLPVVGGDRPGQVIHVPRLIPRTFACRLIGKSSFRSIIALRSAKVRLSQAGAAAHEHGDTMAQFARRQK